MMLNA
jgi:hypothetical protein